MNSKEPLPWTALLKQFWGYDELRESQIGPVKAICSGKDTIAVLPTGGGKSLCYQLSGLVRGGTTLVVSPLIALMEDQLRDLKSRGINAFSLSGVTNSHQTERELDNTERCSPSFLFVSPEKLKSTLLCVRLSQIDIRTVAVDEAHCISEWGHDFRPAYRHLVAIRTIVPSAVWGCFTATATKRVIDDIQANLKLEQPVIFRVSIRRENLIFSVCSVRDSEAMLYQAICNSRGTGLVYVETRYQAEKWALRLEGIEGGVGAYHAGLNKKLRACILRGWVNGEIRIIVCTNAFGMGIDKPDVRWVYHAYIPANIESYIQEAGRAGRDGIQSECVLFAHREMIELRKRKFRQNDPSLLPIHETYQFIANQGEVAIGTYPAQSTIFDLAAFTEKQGHSNKSVERSIQLLQQAGYFGRVSNASEPELSFSFSSRSQTELLEMAETDSDEGIVAKHLAPIAGKAFIRRKQSQFEVIGLAWHRILFTLNRMKEWGVFSFTMNQDLKQIEWTLPRSSSKILIPSEIGAKPYRRAMRGINEFDKFFGTSICRQLFVAEYFGFFDEKPCNQCDNCLRKDQKKVLNELLKEIPKDGVDFHDLIRETIPSRYNLYIQNLKSAKELGHIRFEKMRIYKAD